MDEQSLFDRQPDLTRPDVAILRCLDAHGTLKLGDLELYLASSHPQQVLSSGFVLFRCQTLRRNHLIEYTPNGSFTISPEGRRVMEQLAAELSVGE